MFDQIPVRVWLLILIGIFAYPQTQYLFRYVAASPSRRDITQPSEDLSWRTSSMLFRSLAILAGLAGLAVFIFMPAAERLAKSPSFWPILVACMGAWSLYTVPQGIRTGKVEPFVRGINESFDRETQTKRFWASMTWNGLLGLFCIGFAYPMYTDSVEQGIKDQCYGSKTEVSPQDKLAACNVLLRSRDSSQDDYANLLVARGNAHYRLGDHRRALTDYDQAARLDPSDPYARYNRGLAYDVLGDDRRAILDYSATIKLRPDDAEAYLNRGIIFLDTGRLDQAVSDFTRSHELQPKDAWPLANRGIAYVYKNDQARAEADFSAARAIDPSNPVVFRGEALVAANAGDLALAVNRLTASLNVEPENDWALAMRAAVYRRLGEDDKARADEEKLRRLRELSRPR